MPSRPQRTIIPMDHPHLGKDVDNKLKELYIEKKITPQEYINYITGGYGERPYWVNDHMPADHPHSHPGINDKALERLRQHLIHQKGGHPENELGNDEAKGLARNIIERRHLSPEMINHVIQDHKMYGINNDELARHLKDQPGTNKSHLMQLATDPSSKFGDLVEHPEMDKEVADTLMSDSRRVGRLSPTQIRTMLGTMKHDDPNKRLIDEKGVINLLENNHGIKDPEDFDNLIQHVQPDKDLTGEPDHTKRKEIMNDLLGINGGSYTNEQDHYDNPDHFHYDNWDHGQGYDPKKAAAIAGSKHLTPDQIDHIKRHGDFDQKYALFQNKHIDPKHSGEMYKHWVDDDSDKGYDLDELKERIKKDNPYEDSNDDYYEEAREAEQEDYPFKDYVKENVDDNDLMDGKLIRNAANYNPDTNEAGHDWEAPNPKHKDDPDNENETIDYGGRDKDEHPEYNDRYAEAQKKYDEELEARRSNPQDALQSASDGQALRRI